MSGFSTEPARPWLRSASGLAWIGFAAIAAFYLLTEHRAHVLGALPFAIFLLCPLLHMFHHGRHGGDRSHNPERGERPGSGAPSHRHDVGGLNS